MTTTVVSTTTMSSTLHHDVIHDDTTTSRFDSISENHDRLRVLFAQERNQYSKKRDWIQKAIIKKCKRDHHNVTKNKKKHSKQDVVIDGCSSNSSANSTTSSSNTPIGTDVSSISDATLYTHIEHNNKGIEVSLTKKTKKNKFRHYENQYDNEDEIHTMVNRHCRTLMIEWMYTMIDMCQMDSYVTIEIATSYMDRFMYTKKGQYIVQQNERDMFQLVCVTSLYMAIKLFEPIVVDSKTMVNLLCHEQYKVSQLEQMEMIILQALSWNIVHTPTTTLFLQAYLDPFVNEMKSVLPHPTMLMMNEVLLKQDLMKVAQQQTKWYHQSNHPNHMIMKSSKVAYQSLLYAFHQLILQPIHTNQSMTLSKQQKHQFYRRFRQVIGMDTHPYLASVAVSYSDVSFIPALSNNDNVSSNNNDSIHHHSQPYEPSC
jgi:Cyclin, N-terminal domain